MNRLGTTDAAFLYAETESVPMHVAGLQHFVVPPEGSTSHFEDVRRHLEAHLHLVPYLTRKVRPSPLGLDHPVWVRDDDFCIDHHLRHLRLPAPGTQAQLETLVAELHEVPLDRSRPLWEFTLIEGLEDGTVAWYTKSHHACIDGMAGQALMELIMHATPEAPTPPAPGPRDDRDPGLLALLGDSARASRRRPLEDLGRLPSLLRTAGRLLRALAEPGGLGALEQRAPRTALNVGIGASRTYAAGSIPLSPVKAIGRTQDCKVNDVFLAICSEALVRWFAQRGGVPDRPLIAGAPVSMRAPGDSTLNNNVTMMLTSLETQRSNLLERMVAIRDSSRRGKRVVEALGALASIDLRTPGVAFMLRGAAVVAERLRLAERLPPPVNVVISNVPGPRTTRWFAGARMCSSYPVSIPAHGVALNITVTSYLDRLDFAVTACADAVPDADTLRDHMLDAFLELADACGVDSGRTAPSAAPSPALDDRSGWAA